MIGRQGVGDELLTAGMRGGEVCGGQLGLDNKVRFRCRINVDGEGCRRFRPASAEDVGNAVCVRDVYDVYCLVRTASLRRCRARANDSNASRGHRRTCVRGLRTRERQLDAGGGLGE